MRVCVCVCVGVCEKIVSVCLWQCLPRPAAVGEVMPQGGEWATRNSPDTPATIVWRLPAFPTPPFLFVNKVLGLNTPKTGASVENKGSREVIFVFRHRQTFIDSLVGGGGVGGGGGGGGVGTSGSPGPSTTSTW